MNDDAWNTLWQHQYPDRVQIPLKCLQCDSPNDAVTYLCHQLQIPFHRFNPPISEKIAAKEVSADKLVKMMIETKKYCLELETSERLHYVVQLLHAAVRANTLQARYRSTVSETFGKE